MSTNALLSRLSKVKRTGLDKFAACCPAHDDTSPSLHIRETEDGRTLIRCFAGCSADEVVSALGLSLADLMPPRPLTDTRLKSERRPFFPSDVFEIARLEIGVASVIAIDMHKGRSVSEGDYERLWQCVERLNGITEAAYER